MLRSVRLLLPLLAATLVSTAFAAATPIGPRIDSLLGQLAKVRSIDAVQLSPDGRQLAWVVDVGGKPGIELADADGSHPRRLHPANKPGSCSEGEIAWAPDSRRLAFLSDCGHAPTGGAARQLDLLVADTRSAAAPTVLAALKGYAHALRWSADGQRLGFLYVEGATRRASAVAAAKPAAGEIGVDGLEVQRVASVAARSVGGRNDRGEKSAARGQIFDDSPAHSRCYGPRIGGNMDRAAGFAARPTKARQAPRSDRAR